MRGDLSALGPCSKLDCEGATGKPTLVCLGTKCKVPSPRSSSTEGPARFHLSVLKARYISALARLMMIVPFAFDIKFHCSATPT